MRGMSRTIQALFWALVAAVLPSCGKGGTGTGNPGIEIVSEAYNSSLAARETLFLKVPFPSLGWVARRAFAAPTSISSFKFCVTKMKLRGLSGIPIPGDDGSEILDVRLGLIDLGAGTSQVSWGTPALPDDVVVERIEIEIHKDSETCSGASYSIEANGQPITKDIAFKFRFASPRALSDAAGKVTLALDQLISRVDLAVQAGQFDDEHIESYLDGSFEDECR